jgi:uncharacterized protein YjbI with pentapeptide repeats
VDQDVALGLLKGGEAGVAEWNRRRSGADTSFDLRGADLCTANLAGADLHFADLGRADLVNADLHQANLEATILSGAILIGANFRGANLTRANLVGADLSSADLRSANLQSANLRVANLDSARLDLARLDGANLNGAKLTMARLDSANLSYANLSGANLNSTILRGAILSGAILRGASFIDADLTAADLGGACLALARLIRCNMKHARVNNAEVTNIHLQDILFPPVPPESLLTDGAKQSITGEDARTFFTLPARVEVFLTKPLSETEIAVYYLHLSELKIKGIALGVFLVGHRHHDSGSVLRFQSSNYDEIYQTLPDLMAPFPLAQAIDWRKSLDAIPLEQRTEALMVLTQTAILPTEKRWEFAERMAAFFKESFGKARIYRIDDGRRQGLRVDIFTSEAVARELAEVRKQKHRDSPPIMNVAIQHSGSGSLQLEGPRMGDEMIVMIKGDAIGAAIGAGAKVDANDINVFKDAVHQNLTKSPATDEVKLLVRQLIEQIQTIANKVPSAATTQMGEDAVILSREMAKPTPRREWYELSATGLKDAATAAGEIGKPLLEIVAKLASLLVGA